MIDYLLSGSNRSTGSVACPNYWAVELGRFQQELDAAGSRLCSGRRQEQLQARHVRQVSFSKMVTERSSVPRSCEIRPRSNLYSRGLPWPCITSEGYLEWVASLCEHTVSTQFSQWLFCRSKLDASPRVQRVRRVHHLQYMNLHGSVIPKCCSWHRERQLAAYHCITSAVAPQASERETLATCSEVQLFTKYPRQNDKYLPRARSRGRRDFQSRGGVAKELVLSPPHRKRQKGKRAPAWRFGQSNL